MCFEHYICNVTPFLTFLTPSSVLTSQVSPFPRSSLCLLSLCEYFTLLLPLVRDAGTERSLCVCSVGATVCGSSACGVSWQACGRWRQPAACLSVLLSVLLHLTGADIATSTHNHICTHTQTCTHVQYDTSTWSKSWLLINYLTQIWRSLMSY